MIESFKLKTTSTCPKCFKLLDGAANPSGKEEPRIGDYSICGYCSAPLEFVDTGGTLGYRELTEQDLMAMPEPEFNTIRRMRSLVRTIQLKKK